MSSFPCFHHPECELLQRNRMQRWLTAQMQANGHASQCIRTHPPWGALKATAVNELLLIVLISQQPQWPCILRDRMCFRSLILIPEIKENRSLPHRPDQPSNTVAREAWAFASECQGGTERNERTWLFFSCKHNAYKAPNYEMVSICFRPLK